jgi:hypothetical protein
MQADRAAGALEWLPSDLANQDLRDARRGDFAAAASLITESDAAAEATGIRIALPYTHLLLASLRGSQTEFTRLRAASIAAATAEGQGTAATFAHWTAAILYNGLGRYDEAFAAAQEAREHSHHLLNALWGLPEQVEAAVRTGHTQVAADALDALTQTTQAAGTDYGADLTSAAGRSRSRRRGPDRRHRAGPTGDRRCIAGRQGCRTWFLRSERADAGCWCA